MRADHSRHHFFGWIATASALASRLHAYVAPAATMASPPESNGASALVVSPGTRSTSETGTPSVVDGTRTAVDSNPTSGTPRTLAPSPTMPGGLLSATSGPPASGSANPGQQLVPVTTPARQTPLSPPTSPRFSPPGTTPPRGHDDRPAEPLNRRLRWRDSGTDSGPRTASSIAADPRDAVDHDAFKRHAAGRDKSGRDGALRHTTAHDTARRDIAERDKPSRDRTRRDRTCRDAAAQR